MDRKIDVTAILLDNEMDKKIDVTAILFLLVQKRQQTHDWTLIGSGVNGLGIQDWTVYCLKSSKYYLPIIKYAI